MTGLATRLAARNIARRPVEAALVVIGSLLGTAVIVAAFVVGDSFDGSIRTIARAELGPIDEIVRVRAPAAELGRRVGQLEDRLAHTSIAHVDGLLPAQMAGVVLSNGRRGDAAIAEPNACVMEVEPAAVRRFGRDPDLSGFATIRHQPDPGTLYVRDDVARRLGVAPGDSITLHAYGTSNTLRVARVVPRVGVAGHCAALVPSGTILELDAALRAPTDAALAPSGVVFVSNDGGLEDSARYSAEVVRQLRRATRDFDAEVQSAKATTLDNAERTGGNLRTLFSAIGGFSVTAGVLLLVNLVVMLAEERKRELGVFRAIGLRRAMVWRSFCIEGLVYAVSSATAGLGVGIAVGQLVVVGANQILRDPDDPFTLSLTLRVPSLLAAAAIGAGISALTVAATSGRLARFNVIAAIRDLPDPPRPRRRRWATVVAVLGAVMGIGAFAIGWATASGWLLLGGPVVTMWSLNVVLARRFPTRLVVTTVATLVVGWCLAVFPLFPDQMSRPSIGVFVEMGLILVAAAVVHATHLDRIWARLVRHLTTRGRGVSVHLALSSPLARRFRTGLLLAMFSLVIFTMAFLGAFASILAGSATSGARDISAGFDLIVDSNPSNPLSAATLRARPEVAEAVGLVRGSAEFTNRYQPEPTRWAMTGVDDSFIRFGTPTLIARARGFADDREAFRELTRDPNAIVVDAEFLQSGSAPASEQPRVGDRVVARNRAGERRTFRVIGVLRSDYAFHGTLVGATTARSFLAPAAVENQLFVRLKPHEPATLVARRLSATFVDNGVSARTFPKLVRDRLSETTGFIGLMQAYLGFGLVIGLAGLGVVMVRAVRERRRQIGMLRAMGTSVRTIRAAFLLESTFITAQAILIGLSLGLLTAWLVVVRSGAFSDAAVDFRVPWATVLALAVIPLLAALAATAVPAARAARIRPAVALRDVG